MLPDIITTAPIEGDAYIYPIQPDTPEWAELGSLEEKIAACQVPEDILQQLSTRALVDTIMTYPLMGNDVFYWDPQTGLEENFAHANCVQELYTREDAATELLAKYRWLLPATINDLWSFAVKMMYILDIKIVETLWQQQPIQEQATPEQIKTFNIEKKDKILHLHFF